MRLTINDRERDTIIAALRYWQTLLDSKKPNLAAIYDIADNDHDDRLTVEEIDELIEERVNA